MFEAKELAGKFSIDGLASCAFGVEAGSFDGEDSTFLRHMKGVFNFEKGFIVKIIYGIIKTEN